MVKNKQRLEIRSNVLLILQLVLVLVFQLIEGSTYRLPTTHDIPAIVTSSARQRGTFIMEELCSQDLKDVLTVTHVALECEQIDTLRSEALYRLQEIFKSEKCTSYLTCGPDYDRVDLKGMIGTGIDPEFRDRYNTYYYRLDPLYSNLFSLPSVVTVDDLVPSGALEKSEYYNDFQQPQSICYEMCVVLRSHGRLFGAFSLARPLRTGNFTSSEKNKAGLMAPYLAKILENRLLLGTMAAKARVYECASMGIPHLGTMFLNESLELIDMDESAGQMLASLAGEPEQGVKGRTRLPEEFYQNCETLLKNARIDGSSDPGECQFTMSSAKSGKKLSILARLIEQGEESRMLVARLSMDDPFAYLKQRLEKLGLTRRECEVVYLVCNGLKNKEISDKLYISRYTVQTHLKTIFDKVGVSNRSSLIHHVFTLS
jgi:DNA-binding CsgD family transcriptional regulator